MPLPHTEHSQQPLAVGGQLLAADTGADLRMALIRAYPVAGMATSGVVLPVLPHRETNILGYQGLELYGTGNGLVHEGFYNILHVGDVNPIKVSTARQYWGPVAAQWAAAGRPGQRRVYRPPGTGGEREQAISIACL